MDRHRQQDGSLRQTSPNTNEKFLQGKTIGNQPPLYQYPEPRAHELNESTSTPYVILSKMAEESPRYRHIKISWILLQIVAVTFRIDIEKLRTAVINAHSDWAVVLLGDLSTRLTDAKGEAVITELCTLVKTFERELARNRWLLIHPRDKILLKKLVVGPCQDLKLNLDFALELLGQFKVGPNQCEPENSLLNYWMRSTYAATDPGDAMASHFLFVQNLKLREKPRRIMEDGIAAFQKDCALEKLGTSKELQKESLLSGQTCCWPLSDGYMDLAKTMRTLRVGSDPYYASRTRLIGMRRKANWLGRIRLGLSRLRRANV